MTFLQKKHYYKRFFVAGVFILLLVVIAAANFGVADISFKQTAMILMSKIPIINGLIDMKGIKATSVIILLQLRLPRIILACLVGAALSVVGAAFQGIFKNPMADPFVLGVSSGAALGASITMVFLKEIEFLGLSVIAFNAFL